MKICILTDQFENIRSGTGTYARNLVDGLSKKNHHVCVLTPDTGLSSRTGNVRIIQLPHVPFNQIHPSWPLKALVFARVLNQIMKSEQFDLIHFNDARESLFFKTKNIPVVGTIHDYYFAEAPASPFDLKRLYFDWPLRWIYYRFTRKLEANALRGLAHIIAVSNAVSNSIAANYHIQREKISTVYTGITVQENVQSLRKPPHPTIAFIGGNVQRKGLPLLIKSAPLIAKKFPNYKVLIIGNNRATQELEKQCGAQGLSRHFQFMGNISNKRTKELLMGSSLLAIPSLMEGFGLAFLEAMSLGIPVIGGNIGGTRELIQDGENGFLVDPANEKELADKIIRLLSDSELCERFRKNGLETAQKFTVERMTDETLKVYERALLQNSRHESA